MPDQRRRSQDPPPRSPRSALLDAACLALGIGILVLLGISLRGPQGLAPLWPAAPVLLGLLLRFPRWMHSLSWAGALLGWSAAEFLAGTAPWPALVSALGNVLSVGLAYLTFSRTTPSSRSLHTPASVLHMLLACLVAAVAHGFWSAHLMPDPSKGIASRQMLYWFACDLVNYVAFLPLALTLPAHSWRPAHWLRTLRARRKEPRHVLPALLLALSAAVAAGLHAPGAVALAIPALLWCAISYTLFSTALLSALVGMGFFLPSLLERLGNNLTGAPLAQLLSEQVMLAVLMLAPLTVASVMAAHQELAQRMRILADFDQLTRLPMRSAFFQWGTKLIQHRHVQRLPVSLLYFDIDQLQHINNTYGHDVGDQVLKAFARHLQHSLRRQDCLGRLGGEEFGAILCNQTEQDTHQILERICLRFAAQSIVLTQGESLRCTVSAGGICCERAPQTLAALLSQAEMALRQAQRAGRGQWRLQHYLPTAEPGYSGSAAPSATPARPHKTVH